jgi:hypothetical protein
MRCEPNDSAVPDPLPLKLRRSDDRRFHSSCENPARKTSSYILSVAQNPVAMRDSAKVFHEHDVARALVLLRI